MLATRVLTAVVLSPLVLAALFLLPPLGWGAVSLVAIVAAAAEWASLAGYRKPAWLLFVADTLLLGINLVLGIIAYALLRSGWKLRS